MNNSKYTYWQDDNMWVGYLDEYKDYMTQGKSLQELKENLISLRQELTQNYIPCVIHHASLLEA